MATAADGPFFTLRLVTINVSSGVSRTIGNNWPQVPVGFSGVNGLFFSLDFDPIFGLVVGLTEISKYGPLPTQADEPGLPVGWTVVATVDPSTSASTALTANLSPVLKPYPPIVHGVSALDASGATLWLLASSTSPPLGRTATRQQSARFRNRYIGTPDVDTSFFLGVGLSGATAAVAVAPVALPTVGGGLLVTAFKYSSVVKALISLEFNATGLAPNRPFNLNNGAIIMYPTNGSAPIEIGIIPMGQINPGFGQAEVSSDGRFVYFAAVQGEDSFFSAALITVDVIARTFNLELAAPNDTYDVLALLRCV